MNPSTDTADIAWLSDLPNPAVRLAALTAPHTPSDLVARIATTVASAELSGQRDGYSAWDLAAAAVRHPHCDTATAATIGCVVAALPGSVGRLFAALADRFDLDAETATLLSEAATQRAHLAAAEAQALRHHPAIPPGLWADL